MARYKIKVDGNFHYQDETERGEGSTYNTPEEALAVCRQIVDRSLKWEYKPGMTAEVLYDYYKSFGDDPFIVIVDGPAEGVKFSAWAYAKERCQATCEAASSSEQKNRI